MFQQPLPEHIKNMSDAEAHAFVRRCKEQLGKRVLILGHHYQRDEVIVHADYTGDSLKLAKIGAEQTAAEYIVFCGVHFMAETAVILASEHQKVSLPDLGAGCDMADMAETYDVKQAWQDALEAKASKIVPVTYINSKASLKAFVGDHGGTVCTSGNAERVITWALEHGRHVFFLPDQHLGRNICKKLGLSPEVDMLLWDPKLPFGGHSPEKLNETKVWLWKGHCPVHALFTVKQIQKLRVESPNVEIVVHPECAMEVVDLADQIGSTEQIIRYVEAAPSGSHIAVGTEKHLVERLAQKYADKKIVSLNPYTCPCATMNRISLRNLAWVMEGLIQGVVRNQIEVPKQHADSARHALRRMFELS